MAKTKKTKKARHVKILQLENLNTALVIKRNSFKIGQRSFFKKNERCPIL